MSFAPVEQSLRAAVETWFAEEPTPGAAASVTVNSAAVETRARPLLEMLKRRGVPSLDGREVIDIGCGFGALSVYLAWTGARIVGIDPDPSRFGIGRAAAEEHGLDVELRQGRMQALDAAEASFDVAVMNNTFCYVLDRHERRSALSEARRVLRPGGVLVMREPNGLHPVDQFTRLPLLPLLPPAFAARAAQRAGHTRPQVRLATPPGLRRGLRAAGFADIHHEGNREGAVYELAKPVARYQHFTARRPR